MSDIFYWTGVLFWFLSSISGAIFISITAMDMMHKRYKNFYLFIHYCMNRKQFKKWQKENQLEVNQMIGNNE